jgi:ribosomal protein L39E
MPITSYLAIEQKVMKNLKNNPVPQFLMTLKNGQIGK